MSPITWEMVVGLIPSMSSVDPTTQAVVLEYVNGAGIAPSAFDGESGIVTRFARVFLAAHYASTIPAQGAVSEQSADGVSISFAVAPATEDALELTSYGRQYLSIVRRSGGARFPLVMS